jgi:hypothetical protein
MGMLCTAEIGIDKTVSKSDNIDFPIDAAWGITSTYHTVLKASPDTAVTGRYMLFGVGFMTNWNKVGRHRWCQKNRNTSHKN